MFPFPNEPNDSVFKSLGTSLYNFRIYISYFIQVGPIVIRDDEKPSPELQNAVENEVKRLIKVK